MVEITLKAKHYYYIVNCLKEKSVQKYYPVINRIASSLLGNTDLEAQFSVNATPSEVIDIFVMLTYLPEGQANAINVEMDSMLGSQIIAGATQEGINGIGPDADGNLPDDAYWQIIAKGITYQRNMNTTNRNNAIQIGKDFIDSI